MVVGRTQQILKDKRNINYIKNNWILNLKKYGHVPDYMQITTVLGTNIGKTK